MNLVLEERKDYSENQSSNSKIFLLNDITTASKQNPQSNLITALETTTSGVILPSTETTRKSVHELRKLTGLTWEQIAKLFNVSRRTIHFWGSGKRLNSANEEQLNLLLETIKYINRGSASQNRHLLLQDSNNGRRYLNLLITGEYDTVKKELGEGKNAPNKVKSGSLSEEARAMRKPPSPETLVDALQEPIHHTSGRSRPAKSVRSRKQSK